MMLKDGMFVRYIDKNNTPYPDETEFDDISHVRFVVKRGVFFYLFTSRAKNWDQHVNTLSEQGIFYDEVNPTKVILFMTEATDFIKGLVRKYA